MGQTDDLLTAVAETLPNAILVGAIGFGDGNFSVFDCNRVVAAVGRLKHHFLIDMKIDGGGLAAAFDLCQF